MILRQEKTKPASSSMASFFFSKDNDLQGFQSEIELTLSVSIQNLTPRDHCMSGTMRSQRKTSVWTEWEFWKQIVMNQCNNASKLWRRLIQNRWEQRRGDCPEEKGGFCRGCLMSFVLSRSLSTEKLGENNSDMGTACAKAWRCLESDPAVLCGGQYAWMSRQGTKGGQR